MVGDNVIFYSQEIINHSCKNVMKSKFLRINKWHMMKITLSQVGAKNLYVMLRVMQWFGRKKIDERCDDSYFAIDRNKMEGIDCIFKILKKR